LELLFESHHELDRVERIGAEVVDKRGCVLDLRFVDAELLRDDFLDALFNVFHCGLLPLVLLQSKSKGANCSRIASPRGKPGQLIYMPPFTSSVAPGN